MKCDRCDRDVRVPAGATRVLCRDCAKQVDECEHWFDPKPISTRLAEQLVQRSSGYVMLLASLHRECKVTESTSKAAVALLQKIGLPTVLQLFLGCFDVKTDEVEIGIACDLLMEHDLDDCAALLKKLFEYSQQFKHSQVHHEVINFKVKHDLAPRIHRR